MKCVLISTKNTTAFQKTMAMVGEREWEKVSRKRYCKEYLVVGSIKEAPNRSVYPRLVH